MQRRQFLKSACLSAAAAASRHSAALAPSLSQPDLPSFSTADSRWQRAYDKALEILAGNVQVMPRFPGPVLIEGASYPGVWQECGPHESLVYRHFRPDVARNNHMTFFALQRPDGQLPANNKRTETGFGQIQMVVPIAATAWELASATGDSELVETAYKSCAGWDGWLMRYRNTRGTGLIEGFCTYDSGMDNSPRWAGIAPQCPGKDARRCPSNPTLPRLCPDLSATVYGARLALAAMAAALGKSADAARWQESAFSLRTLMLEKLYDHETSSFYDLDAQNNFVRVRCDILSRMCGEHVVDATMFEAMWTQQLGNPHAFWAPFPLPSIALDDPVFVRPIPRNCWGGPSQALTALRAGRWFDHYGRSSEFAHMMLQWCEALQLDMTFRQQADPLTGEFTQADQPGYSPAALVMYDYTWRLAGVREDGDDLHWNVRPNIAAAKQARFRLSFRGGAQAEMLYSGKGADLRLNGRSLAHIEGIARMVTDRQGRFLYAVGADAQPQTVHVKSRARSNQSFVLPPNARHPFA